MAPAPSRRLIVPSPAKRSMPKTRASADVQMSSTEEQGAQPRRIPGAHATGGTDHQHGSEKAGQRQAAREVNPARVMILGTNRQGADRKALGAFMSKLRRPEGYAYFEAKGAEYVSRAIRIMVHASALVKKHEPNKLLEIIIARRNAGPGEVESEDKRYRLSALVVEGGMFPAVPLDPSGVAKQSEKLSLPVIVGRDSDPDKILTAIMIRMEIMGEVMLEGIGPDATHTMVKATARARATVRPLNKNIAVYLDNKHVGDEGPNMLGKATRFILRPGPRISK